MAAFLPLAIGLPSAVICLATARGLFRYWVRNDTFMVGNAVCSHGYARRHNRQPCHGEQPLDHFAVALIALGAGIIFPLVLAFFIVMYHPPMGLAEVRRKLAELESENSRLRAEQER